MTPRRTQDRRAAKVLYLHHQGRLSLYTDKLVSADSLALAFTPNLESYGFGWRIDVVDSKKRYHHSGSTSGFRNYIERYPDDHLTVIVLSNRADPDVAPLAHKVTAIFLR